MTKEVTDAKPDETSDQPEEEYGFMEARTLDSENEDEVENVPKSVPEIVPEIVPNKQKCPESENNAQKEDAVLSMESITIDSENKEEVKIEVKDKNLQVLGFPKGQNFIVLRTKGQPECLATGQDNYSQVPNKQVGPNKRVGWLF